MYIYIYTSVDLLIYISNVMLDRMRVRRDVNQLRLHSWFPVSDEMSVRCAEHSLLRWRSLRLRLV